MSCPYLVYCDDEEEEAMSQTAPAGGEVISLATTIPPTRLGRTEVRPIRECRREDRHDCAVARFSVVRTGGKVMTTETPRATPEAEIRELMESWVTAVRARDVDRILSHYAGDVVAFDAVSQLQFSGVDAYGKHWRACLSMCSGPMVFEVQDLNITASRDVAYGHFLNRCGGTDGSGEEKACWMRATECYRKTNGKWAIVHEHFSVPFDMESGKALFDLKP